MTENDKKLLDDYFNCKKAFNLYGLDIDPIELVKQQGFTDEVERLERILNDMKDKE